MKLAVVYVEPTDYRHSAAPTEGEIFDLSERIAGVAPIPGFASLNEVADENSRFVPLLGFEGVRLAHILEHVQPQGRKITPIIGVPGFRAEYPFYSFLGNRSVLVKTGAWRNTMFAPAFSPFSLFYVLEELANESDIVHLKIAPIGTKPHALGAVLFALTRPSMVELVYDHPVRKPERTQGTGRLWVYHLSAFIRG